MNTSLRTLLGVAVLLAATTGCSNTVRSLTASTWIAPPGSGGPPTSSSPPAPVTPAAEGQPAATGAAAPPPAAPPPAPVAGGIVSHYYLTYWEGSCGGMFGCSRGNTKVKHCTVAADNSVNCAEDAAATKALTTQ